VGSVRLSFAPAAHRAGSLVFGVFMSLLHRRNLPMSASHPVVHTRLCDLLGIDYPILQSGMGTVAGPELVAAVSNAGGLGILAGFLLPADQLRP
jgi:hypothetical protein